MTRMWAVLDDLAHRVHTPSPLLRWVCDRYDRSLGVTETEMHRRWPWLRGSTHPT